jgi:hypothetical protein
MAGREISSVSGARPKNRTYSGSTVRLTDLLDYVRPQPPLYNREWSGASHVPRLIRDAPAAENVDYFQARQRSEDPQLDLR